MFFFCWTITIHFYAHYVQRIENGWKKKQQPCTIQMKIVWMFSWQEAGHSSIALNTITNRTKIVNSKMPLYKRTKYLKVILVYCTCIQQYAEAHIPSNTGCPTKVAHFLGGEFGNLSFGGSLGKSKNFDREIFFIFTTRLRAGWF